MRRLIIFPRRRRTRGVVLKVRGGSGAGGGASMGGVG
ncbi:hypothetical protein OROHE_018264 [Orobanche hederae]